MLEIVRIADQQEQDKQHLEKEFHLYLETIRPQQNVAIIVSNKGFYASQIVTKYLIF